MDKQLKEKAIQFKGKAYVLVSDRVNYFNEVYPNGSIQTQLISEPSADMVVIKAIVTPDTKEQRFFTGYSQAKWSDTSSFVNKTSALENCETSAVGRALAFMGIGVIDSIASVDEINKTSYTSPSPLKQTEIVKPTTDTTNTMEVRCGVCNSLMVHKTGVSKSTGKPYDGWFCPKDDPKGVRHTPRFI
jgi:hypothetical protein